MEDVEIRDQLMTLLVAGHETTATGLAWTLDLLTRHPETLERARTGGETYLRAVVAESLRLRPVVPLAGRRLAVDLVVDGLTLPAGTDVTPSMWLAHTRPDEYPEPYAFKPERFLDKPPSTYTWIPFGGGVRRCIGAPFAELEMRIVLEEVLARYEIRPAGRRPEGIARRNVTFSPGTARGSSRHASEGARPLEVRQESRVSARSIPTVGASSPVGPCRPAGGPHRSLRRKRPSGRFASRAAGSRCLRGVRRRPLRAGYDGRHPPLPGGQGPDRRRPRRTPDPARTWRTRTPSGRFAPVATRPERLGRRRAAVRAGDPRLPARLGRRRLRRPHQGRRHAPAGLRRPARGRRGRPGDHARPVRPARHRARPAEADNAPIGDPYGSSRRGFHAGIDFPPPTPAP